MAGVIQASGRTGVTDEIRSTSAGIRTGVLTTVFGLCFSRVNFRDLCWATRVTATRAATQYESGKQGEANTVLIMTLTGSWNSGSLQFWVPWLALGTL